LRDRTIDNCKSLDRTTVTVVPTDDALRFAGVTKKLDVQTGTEAEAFSLADFDKPWGAGGECFHIDALGHEEDLV
jgi:hypothetical protein